MNEPTVQDQEILSSLIIHASALRNQPRHLRHLAAIERIETQIDEQRRRMGLVAREDEAA